MSTVLVDWSWKDRRTDGDSWHEPGATAAATTLPAGRLLAMYAADIVHPSVHAPFPPPSGRSYQLAPGPEHG